MSVQVKKTTLSSAQILALHATPINILPAPASGYVNCILGIGQDMTYNSIVYGGGGVLYYGLTNNNTNWAFYDSSGVLLSTYNINMPAARVDSSSVPLSPFPTTKDFFVGSGATTPTNGNSSIDIYVVYEVKPIQ